MSETFEKISKTLSDHPAERLAECRGEAVISHAVGDDALSPDDIHQMAFEEGQPAENGDGYLFTVEEFDLFVERLLTSQSAPAAKGEE